MVFRNPLSPVYHRLPLTERRGFPFPLRLPAFAYVLD